MFACFEIHLLCKQTCFPHHQKTPSGQPMLGRCTRTFHPVLEPRVLLGMHGGSGAGGCSSMRAVRSQVGSGQVSAVFCDQWIFLAGFLELQSPHVHMDDDLCAVFPFLPVQGA